MTRSRVKQKSEGVNRQYRSPLRAEQALLTRRRIRQTAEELFLRDGYAATSMAAIAEAAGVSRLTVFNVFGSKVELLREVADVRLAGDDEPLDVFARPPGRRMLAATDPSEVVRLHARLTGEIMQRVGPLLNVVADAAATDPEAAALHATHDEGRLFGMRATVDRLAELGALRRGVTAEQAAEALWLLSGPEAWNLAQRRRWSLRRYIDWYHRCARAVLLEEVPV
jgi:AcrR family transcriptional regulator